MSAAVRATWSEVLLTKVVDRAEPFQSTLELASKPVPVTVTVTAWPWGTVDGERPVTAGVGLMTVKAVDGEAPPPGEGFDTVSEAVSPAARAAAGTAAEREVELVKVV